MADIEFIQHEVTARVPELTNPTSIIEVPLTVRVDPLSGRTSRLITGTKLAPTERPDLTALTADPPFCPFCESKIEMATGTLDPSITDEGRIRRGNSAIVPNVMAYSEFSSVGLYDITRHFVDLDELTDERVGNLFSGFVDYTKGVHGLRPMWSSVNANYLPPSGSSLVHPHAQSAHDDFGTSTQRRLIELSNQWDGDSFWSQLTDAEEGGPRWVGRRGRVAVLTPWAPAGFHEVWAIVDGCRDITDLTADDVADLAAVMSAVFGTYHSLNLTSFNWAMYGGGPQPSDKYSLLWRSVSRSNADVMYRSDVTYFEKLHDEAMVDVTPEDMAQIVRDRFGA